MCEYKTGWLTKPNAMEKHEAVFRLANASRKGERLAAQTGLNWGRGTCYHVLH
jgi:hypothetical protein